MIKKRGDNLSERRSCCTDNKVGKEKKAKKGKKELDYDERLPFEARNSRDFG